MGVIFVMTVYFFLDLLGLWNLKSKNAPHKTHQYQFSKILFKNRVKTLNKFLNKKQSPSDLVKPSSVTGTGKRRQVLKMKYFEQDK